MSGPVARITAAIAHFVVIARDRGVREACVRSQALVRRRVRHVIQNTARTLERRQAGRLPRPGVRIRAYASCPDAMVRIAVEASPNEQLSNATLLGIARLRDATPLSYEVVAGPAARALSTVSENASEAFLAYLPAGVVPLSGWLDRALDAMNGLDADAAAPNFGEALGAAYAATTISPDGALWRRGHYPTTRCAYAPEAQVVDARAESIWQAPARRERRRITVVDVNLPMPDRDGGSMRMREILSILARENDVTIVAAEGRKVEPYYSELLRSGIDVVLDDVEADAAFRSADVVWIARPSCAERYLACARKLNPQARIVYDTVDLHHLREQRSGKLNWQITRANEARAILAADMVVTVSNRERTIADELGARRSVVIPTIHRPVAEVKPFSARSGLLFVGSFDHAPNVDGATYLVDQIMPRVWQAMPEITITIAGSNPPRTIRGLAQSGVNVVGYVKELDLLLQSHRVSLAPLRFGAGLKAKVTQALAFGLPVICTSIAAEGFEGAARDAMVIADDAEAFAQGIVATYDDEAAWQRLSNQAFVASRVYAPSAIAPAVLEAIAGQA